MKSEEKFNLLNRFRKDLLFETEKVNVDDDKITKYIEDINELRDDIEFDARRTGNSIVTDNGSCVLETTKKEEKFPGYYRARFHLPEIH